MDEARLCSLCGCYCVACLQLADGCDGCELLHPELLEEDLPSPLLPDLNADIT